MQGHSALVFSLFDELEVELRSRSVEEWPTCAEDHRMGEEHQLVNQVGLQQLRGKRGASDADIALTRSLERGELFWNLRFQLGAAARIELLPAGQVGKVALTVEGTVPGIDAAAFQEAAETAKENCPVSKALAGVPEITLEAHLH